MTITKTEAGHALYYEVTGNLDSDNSIVFCHGNGNCLDDWKALGYTQYLGKDYKLILMDALGYGKSDKPYHASYYTPEERAKQVITVLDALYEKQVHFFGNSIGGSLGFVLAYHFPERFLSFSIGSAHPYGKKEAIGCNIYPKAFTDRMQKEGAQRFVVDLEEQLIKRKFPAAVKSNFLKNDLKALAYANDIDWKDDSTCLRNLTAPVMLFAGEKDPVSKFLPEIKALIPNCEIHILQGKDHAQAYWEGDTVAPLVAQFIATCASKHPFLK